MTTGNHIMNPLHLTFKFETYLREYKKRLTLLFVSDTNNAIKHQ